MVEGSDCFFHGGISVWSVGVDQVDVVELEAFEGLVHAFDDVLSGEPNVVYWSGAEG